MRLLIFLYLFSMPLSAMEYFDGHIHYNQDLWNGLPPEQVITLLHKYGIELAIVSSTPTEGTEALYDLAPERIIPFLRPYRNRADRYTWHHDREILDYVRSWAATGKYRGFGEFHIDQQHLDGKSLFAEYLQLAVDNNWPLSAHTDEETIHSIFRMQPELHVIWAHCGFDTPVAKLRELMTSYPRLYCELSF